MEKFIRSFIAIPLTEEIHRNLADFCDRHGLNNRGNGLKPVQPANIHLTIKFLGEVEQSRVASLSKALHLLSKELMGFNISVHGIGAFPAWKRNPRVLWVGVEPVEPLRELFQRVEEVAAGLDYPLENRGFSPHLTLARVRNQTDQLEPLLQRLSHLTPVPRFGEMKVAQLVLFKSVLLPQGPVYTVLSSHPFYN